MLNVKISLNNKQTSNKLTRLSCVNPEGGGLGSGPPPPPPALGQLQRCRFPQEYCYGPSHGVSLDCNEARPLFLLHIMF